ncbi:LodA/GoxA family CTQ-dependent oxidase [Paraburkholderia sediminicola]|uniref:LodA/GoxA family CTQ-dependent oxidase n=1 Tax=Paraburkholderia sediminicola TaxID=458836 RepID=UPI0038B8805A
MPTVYKIHPAIGIARVGNSPDDFFIGPERLGERPEPAGGFKDAQCRVKRQAARFRIYAHHDDGTVEEIDKEHAHITWTVELANRKAAFPGRRNSGSVADLSVTPGPRSLDGPNQRELFDNGTIRFSNTVTTVALGEIRSDSENRLLVLGGSGTSGSPVHSGLGDFWKNPDWYDDVSDGPVSATIQLLSDQSTPAVIGAWVIVAPPKFAPHQDSVMTLYDRVLEVMVTAGLAPPATTTSYTRDIYPILQRARDIHWVINIAPAGAMTWADPVTGDSLRSAIFNSLKVPGGGGDDMPPLRPPDTGDPITFQTDRLTSAQFAHMQRWKDNDYANDWAGPPAPQATVTPDGLDRAALEACVGGSFFPGIEAGGLPQSAASLYPGLGADSRPIANASHYVDAFRLDHGSVSAGDITAAMALPWQADFTDCAQNWWPVPRPNQVIRNGTPGQDWLGGIVGSLDDMVNKWSQLGFVVSQGAQHVETERCQTASITLLTPLLNFQDVPQGPMGMQHDAALAISFEVISPSVAVTLQYAAGGAPSHPQLAPFNTSATVLPTAANGIATARLWIIYKTGNAGDSLPPQVVTVQDAAGTQTWTVTIIGNTVARKTAAVALIMDRSGSMADNRGDGQTKHTSLQQAANIFVDLMLEGDGVGLVRFNQDAQVLQPVMALGDGSLSDVARAATRDIINGNGLDPNGETSIGDGIFEGRGILNSETAPFDVNSLVILTDGMENQQRWIADVAGQINEFTYSVGLGQPQNISVPALQTISGNNGGYLLVTGSISTDNRFLLQKYFLQILAGISNAEIVLDPNGQLVPGRVQSVPFQLTSADAGVDVILLSPYPAAVDFRLQTPGGRIIEPWLARTEPGMRFILSNGVSYYRLALPVQLLPNRFDAAGTWHALLTVGEPRLERTDTARYASPEILRGMFAPPPRAPSRPARGIQAQRASVVAAAAPHLMAAFANARTLPYSLVVHTYSNVSLHAHLRQSSFEPGATIAVAASLAQSGIALTAGATVWAEIVRPDGTTTSLAMEEHGDESFTATFATTTAGVYRVRIRARGTTQHGEPFTREKTLTAAVWRGGDQPGAGSTSGTGDVTRPGVCELLKCLLEQEGALSEELVARLKALGIDVSVVRKCVELICHDHCRCP